MKGCLMTVIWAFAVCAMAGPIVIPMLRRMKCDQTVREDGPKSHLHKTGTPTMGGIIILIAVVLATLPHIDDYPEIAPVLFLTMGFGMVGFLDDYIKVVCKRSLGLLAWQKFGCQLIVTGIFVRYVTTHFVMNSIVRVPLIPNCDMDLGRFYIPIMFFIILGTANGANFTDGLDGLAGSVTAMIAVFFAVYAMAIRSGVAPIACAVAGALMGFLLFNAHPAMVFMGDTGSLALGGFVAGTAYLLGIPLYLAVVGIIYLAEVLSVILQVCFYRISGGKRLFRMAPLHHHFELCGWSETKIVTLFTMITALMCLIGLMGL